MRGGVLGPLTARVRAGLSPFPCVITLCFLRSRTRFRTSQLPEGSTRFSGPRCHSCQRGGPFVQVASPRCVCMTRLSAGSEDAVTVGFHGMCLNKFSDALTAAAACPVCVGGAPPAMAAECSCAGGNVPCGKHSRVLQEAARNSARRTDVVARAGSARGVPRPRRSVSPRATAGPETPTVSDVSVRNMPRFRDDDELMFDHNSGSTAFEHSDAFAAVAGFEEMLDAPMPAAALSLLDVDQQEGGTHRREMLDWLSELWPDLARARISPPARGQLVNRYGISIMR